ncbi:TIGR04141 family sporadically distributed protein [Microbacterium sp. PRF11]|uniref:DUF6119 family protein n=1 Tax=Microbacterium sp. PRF11 TaxID=2962593 RepID=UPI002881D98E|nr:DUF6119 family protein [Microbacterium sp. PRF11]MDT0117522.1 TIGR04141 family sporadically distributed protein [Microbacterium sp. PRF11]
MMASKQGITAPIYKIDVDAALDVVGANVKISALSKALVDLYNKEKGAIVYKLEGTAKIDGATLHLYRNDKARPNTSGWVSFFEGSGIKLKSIKNEMQHLVCFVELGDDLYAYTAGQSAVVFERFTDISFPIDVGRRIAMAEVKGAKASQITGSTLASNMQFRDARRITYTESLDTVWTALSGQLQPGVLDEKALVQIFDVKTKMRLDVTSAVKLGPKVETPEKMVALIRWLAKKAEGPLPTDDGWGWLDAIKVLSPRKKNDLIAQLRRTLATRIFVDKKFENIAVSHTEASLYDNATTYALTQGSEKFLETSERPELREIVAKMKVNTSDVVANFDSVRISTSNDDYGPGFGTTGTLLNHLHGEIQSGTNTYYLLAGKWYEVDASYIDEVKKDFLHLFDTLDLPASNIGLNVWAKADSEGTYNKNSVTSANFINGDRVLTDNVELFDSLVWDKTDLYIVHVKRGFDVKVRDVRSQIVSSAQIIENDLRTGGVKLKEHHSHLVSRGRTKMSQANFLRLFEKTRSYVLAYGTPDRVDKTSIDKFQSSVARMEVVALNSQFRQLSSLDSQAQLQVTWIPIK